MFSLAQARNPQKLFALKQLNSNDPKVFETELISLLYCLYHEHVDESLLKEGQKHMAHVRASFEIRNETKNQADYYLLFDWQEGNLSQFWKAKDKLRADKHLPRWLAQQIFGLAAALQCVHNDRHARLARNPIGNMNTLYGRHGDLKPSNILYSRAENGEGYELKLTDFGLAQLHSRVSRSLDSPMNTKHTETYKGPEFDLKDGFISRATDIFSFGCVVLECITWYLLGHDKVDQFSNARAEEEAHRPGFNTDNYFRITLQEDGTQRAVLKPQVLDQISVLRQHRRCSWYLYEVLELVEKHMLNPDPRQRISSSDLTKKFDTYRRTCETDSTYYTNCWREGTSTDSTFQPSASHVAHVLTLAPRKTTWGTGPCSSP